MKKIEQTSYFLIIITFLISHFTYGFKGIVFSISTIGAILCAVTSYKSKQSKLFGRIGFIFFIVISLIFAFQTVLLKDRIITYTWSNVTGKSIASDPDEVLNIRYAESVAIQVLPLNNDKSRFKNFTLNIKASGEKDGYYSTYYPVKIGANENDRFFALTPTSAFIKLDLDTEGKNIVDVKVIVSIIY